MEELVEEVEEALLEQRIEEDSTLVGILPRAMPNKRKNSTNFFIFNGLQLTADKISS